MKAKLIKNTEGFSLYIPNDESNKWIASTDGMLMDYKLSLKNCQSIERGYDLDELVSKNLDTFPSIATDPDRDLVRLGMEQGFRAGFQKALEILGDRRFTEEDVRKAYNTNHYSQESKDSNWENFTQSLQQNEWEVEILEERDSKGRLILKRVV